MDEGLANSAASAGDDNELFGPVPLIGLPVVQNVSVQEVVRRSGNSQHDANCETFENDAVV